MKIKIEYTPHPWYSCLVGMRYCVSSYNLDKSRGPIVAISGFGKTKEDAVKDFFWKLWQIKTKADPEVIEFDFT